MSGFRFQFQTRDFFWLTAVLACSFVIARLYSELESEQERRYRAESEHRSMVRTFKLFGFIQTDEKGYWETYHPKLEFEFYDNTIHFRPRLQILFVTEFRRLKTPIYHLHADGKVTSEGAEFDSLALAFKDRANDECMFIDVPFAQELTAAELAAILEQLPETTPQPCEVFVKLGPT